MYGGKHCQSITVETWPPPSSRMATVWVIVSKVVAKDSYATHTQEVMMQVNTTRRSDVNR